MFDLRQNESMARGKRSALGTGFGVITALLVLSTALAYQIQESFSQRSVAIHRHYVQDQQAVTSLRRLLYAGGISARDYLLNPATHKSEAYRMEIQNLRQIERVLDRAVEEIQSASESR